VLLLQSCVPISTSSRRAQIIRRTVRSYCQHHFDRAVCRFASQKRGIGVSLNDSVSFQNRARNREPSAGFFGRVHCDHITICIISSLFDAFSYSTRCRFSPAIPGLFILSRYSIGIYLPICSLLIGTSHSFLFFESVIFFALNLLFLLTLALVCSSSQSIPSRHTFTSLFRNARPNGLAFIIPSARNIPGSTRSNRSAGQSRSTPSSKSCPRRCARSARLSS